MANTTSDVPVDFHELPRRRLQSLSKKHGLPANKSNKVMADALATLFNLGKHQHSSSTLFSGANDELGNVLSENVGCRGDEVVAPQLEASGCSALVGEDFSISTHVLRDHQLEEFASVKEDFIFNTDCALENRHTLPRIDDQPSETDTADLSVVTSCAPQSELSSLAFHVESTEGVNVVVDLPVMQRGLELQVPGDWININMLTRDMVPAMVRNRRQDKPLALPAEEESDTTSHVTGETRSVVVSSSPAKATGRHFPLLPSLTKTPRNSDKSLKVSFATSTNELEYVSPTETLTRDDELESTNNSCALKLQDNQGSDYVDDNSIVKIVEGRPYKLVEDRKSTLEGSQQASLAYSSGFVKEMVARPSPVASRKMFYKMSPFHQKVGRSETGIAVTLKLGSTRRGELLAGRRSMSISQVQYSEGMKSSEAHISEVASQEGQIQDETMHKMARIEGDDETKQPICRGDSLVTNQVKAVDKALEPIPAIERGGRRTRAQQLLHPATNRKLIIKQAMMGALKKKNGSKRGLGKVAKDLSASLEEVAAPIQISSETRRTYERVPDVSTTDFGINCSEGKENTLVPGRNYEKLEKHKGKYKTPLTGKSKEKAKKAAQKVAANLRSKILRESRNMSTIDQQELKQRSKGRSPLQAIEKNR